MCKQLSPVIPHNYQVNTDGSLSIVILVHVPTISQDASLPVASFLWHIENLNDEPVEVSIMFTWKAGSG